MIDRQTAIGSGFGARTTADEVLAGCDLKGKTAIVTGGYSGLGFETTRALARAGARVLVTARRPEVARKALTNIPDVEIAMLDLGDLASVRGFAERFITSGRQADILINNAGIMACPETRLGPGWEAQFAVNHLGHYVLVNRLWPAIASGARIVSVASAGHHNSAIRWEDVQFTRSYDKYLAYGQSKTANILFAVHLDILGQASGIRAFSVHPGKILTPLQRHLTAEEMMGLGWIDAQGKLADPTFKTAAQGAATQLWAATAPQLQGRGGGYCEDCDIAEPASASKQAFVGVRDYAVDRGEAARLWQLSAELTGEDMIQ